ncbi:ATP-dependent zinc metalloprotease FtsH 4 [Salinivirga cyanobacteriivorans]|uniref:ATP-dependent zinc metalloprotease FtsH n=1 Tax=Salinivirga cyanobacteriivorans TaxID=1307839 RepID=A0A0S2HYA3_9BACT|nr:ATP-dependent zinc metalloprotease FtsH [Salinivirga cyanobacteriivorans]ALO14946.1 ATP-dependent zinc metalloprotease FtsH 4 [Salinivirga cyanobacteriivorans]
MEKENNQQRQQQNDNSNKTPKRPKFNVYWIYGAILLLFIGMQFFSSMGNGAREITWKDFKNNMLQQHHVERLVVVNKQKVEVYIKPGELGRGRYKEFSEGGFSSGPQYYFTIGSVEYFEKQMDEAQQDFSEEQRISPQYETREDHIGNLIGWLLPIAIIVAIWIFIMRRMTGGGAGGGQIFNIGKSKAKLFDREGSKVKVDFSNVAGLSEAKVEVKEIVDFLKKPERYTELGGKIPKGALLIGPPGTGKTLLAKAVAGEAEVPFFSISGSDFVEMFVGVGASRVRDLFKQAKEKSPCIIFIDEIDAIGRARGKNPNMGSNDERENTLNQLLSEMDGFDTNSGVIILAATNRVDVLDKALMRAGRFDRQIHVELPDLNERKEIFKVHLSPLKKVDPELNPDFLAKQTPGFSGADIANAVNEAALIAARKEKTKVEKQDFLDAIDRIIGGLEKRNKIISKSEKKTIAYHESGHATVSWLLEHANPLVKVTIVPRGQALGAAWYLPEERQITTKEQMIDEMAALMGGRAAEEIVFGKVSTGALNDLERATKKAYAMVTYFGMSAEVGNISFFDSTGQNEYSFTKPYSEETAKLIDKETRKLVEASYQRALKVLRDNRDGHEQLAQRLLEREVIFADDLEDIFGKRKNDIIEAGDKNEYDSFSKENNKDEQNQEA